MIFCLFGLEDDRVRLLFGFCVSPMLAAPRSFVRSGRQSSLLYMPHPFTSSVADQVARSISQKLPNAASKTAFSLCLAQKRIEPDFSSASMPSHLESSPISAAPHSIVFGGCRTLGILLGFAIFSTIHTPPWHSQCRRPSRAIFAVDCIEAIPMRWVLASLCLLHELRQDH